MREEGDPRVGEAAADLISRARAGDGDAFRQLTEPHRRELQVHCFPSIAFTPDAAEAWDHARDPGASPEGSVLSERQLAVGMLGRSIIRHLRSVDVAPLCGPEALIRIGGDPNLAPSVSAARRGACGD
jgi:hypothetical protein